MSTLVRYFFLKNSIFCTPGAEHLTGFKPNLSTLNWALFVILWYLSTLSWALFQFSWNLSTQIWALFKSWFLIWALFFAKYARSEQKKTLCTPIRIFWGGVNLVDLGGWAVWSMTEVKIMTLRMGTTTFIWAGEDGTKIVAKWRALPTWTAK